VFGQADRSIALARDNAFAYQVKCYYYLIVSRRPEEALRAAEAALAINPNSPSAHMARADAESYLRNKRNRMCNKRCGSVRAIRIWPMAQLHG
jgi:hypothetical protein